MSCPGLSRLHQRTVRKKAIFTICVAWWKLSRKRKNRGHSREYVDVLDEIGLSSYREMTSRKPEIQTSPSIFSTARRQGVR